MEVVGWFVALPIVVAIAVATLAGVAVGLVELYQAVGWWAVLVAGAMPAIIAVSSIRNAFRY